MSKSLHETRNPMEISAKVNACMVLELDYKLERYTADDGEQAFRLEIPELNVMGKLMDGPPQIMPTQPKINTRKQERPSLKSLNRMDMDEITRRLKGIQ